MVGDIRQHRLTLRAVTAKARSLPLFDEAERRRQWIERDLHLSAEQIGKLAALIGNVNHLDAGHHIEQLAEHMVGAADAGRRHVDLARIGFGVGNEFRDRLRRHPRIDHHHRRNGDDARDGFDVLDEIELERLVERRIDGVGLRDPEQRVAVRRSLHDGLGGDIGAGAGRGFRPRIAGRAFPTATGRSAGRRCRTRCRAESRRRCGLAATG